MPRQFKIVPKPKKTQISVMRDKVNAQILLLEAVADSKNNSTYVLGVFRGRITGLKWVLREVLK